MSQFDGIEPATVFLDRQGSDHHSERLRGVGELNPAANQQRAVAMKATQGKPTLSEVLDNQPQPAVGPKADQAQDMVILAWPKLATRWLQRSSNRLQRLATATRKRS